MTTINAICPACGEAELTPADVTLMVCNQSELSYYKFGCPKCQDEVRKPADDHVISLLMSGGVRTVAWEVPSEALEIHEGPALSYDDLLDFALCLGGTDLPARLASLLVRRRQR